ncbi:MAG TPA: ester cyclase [Thermoanaerobaculia bacterium]|nr:ester cyclase [Thermoanaerobaculia bacterium]
MTDLQAAKEIGRRFREDLWNSGDLALADELIARDCLVHARVPFPIDFARGPDALRHLIFFYHLAFSEIRVTAEQIVAEGDLVVVRWSARGRHTGHLLGLPPTGRETETSGIDMLRIAGGKIAEGWVSWDTLSLFEQLMDLGDGSGSGFLSLLERFRAPQ